MSALNIQTQAMEIPTVLRMWLESFIWIHGNLVYVKWVHKIFVLMKYSLDRKPGHKAPCPINIKSSGNNSSLLVIDTPCIHQSLHVQIYAK